MKQIVLSRRLYFQARLTPPTGGSVDPSEFIEAGLPTSPTDVVIPVPGLGPNDIVRDVSWATCWLPDLAGFSLIEVERADDQSIRLRVAAFGNGAANVLVLIFVFVHTGGPHTLPGPFPTTTGMYGLRVTARGVVSPLETYLVEFNTYAVRAFPGVISSEIVKEQFDTATNRWIVRSRYGVSNSGMDGDRTSVEQRTEIRYVLRSVDAGGTERARMESQVFTVDPKEHFVSRRAIRVLTTGAQTAGLEETFHASGTRDAPARRFLPRMAPWQGTVVGAGCHPTGEFRALERFAYLSVTPDPTEREALNIVAAPSASGGAYTLPCIALAIWRGPDATPLGPMLLPRTWADEKEKVTPPDAKPAAPPTGTSSAPLRESHYVLRRDWSAPTAATGITAFKRLQVAVAALDASSRHEAHDDEGSAALFGWLRRTLERLGVAEVHRKDTDKDNPKDKDNDEAERASTVANALADVMTAAAEALVAVTPGARGGEISFAVLADAGASARVAEALRAAATTDDGTFSVPRLASAAANTDLLIAQAFANDEHPPDPPWFDQAVVGGSAETDACDGMKR